MATQALPFVSVEKYLSTSFEPDCDYVDGLVEERNVGEWEHATVQKMPMRVFLAREEEWGVTIIQECRLQVAETRFRVPDTMILRAGQTVRRIVREAPLICIEVISPEDTPGTGAERASGLPRHGSEAYLGVGSGGAGGVSIRRRGLAPGWGSACG